MYNIIVCRDPNTTVNEAYLEVVKQTLSGIGNTEATNLPQTFRYNHSS